MFPERQRIVFIAQFGSKHVGLLIAFEILLVFTAAVGVLVFESNRGLVEDSLATLVAGA
jgi:hypothetical protein